MCYYHQHACLGLPVPPVCLFVSQTLMDNSGHKGNTGQVLNSKVLGVLYVITLFMNQVSVFQSESKLSQNHLTHVLINLVLLLQTDMLEGNK